MKILVALDMNMYSSKIVKDVARLSQNTLADLIFLGVQNEPNELDQTLVSSLTRYQKDVYSYFGDDECPYGDFSSKQWEQAGKNDWSVSSKGMKEFTLRVRTGSVSKQVVSVATEMECDLVILGCGKEFGCEWEGEMNIPLRIAEDAPCSVLVVKNSGNSDQIVSFLDQSVVNQDALEMINQMVTIHGASLKIVGVKDKNEDKETEIEKRMVELLTYYNERKVNAWVKLIGSEHVKEYVTDASREAIVALWMGGKQSLIKRIFSKSMVDQLLETSLSSVFILR
jgi:nucleotide-binding universal stress UspA family protein